MNKVFEATVSDIRQVPDPTAQLHTVRGLSATTYESKHYNVGMCHAKMLVGPHDGRCLTMLKAAGETREDALQALEEKLIALRSFLNHAEAAYVSR